MQNDGKPLLCKAALLSGFAACLALQAACQRASGPGEGPMNSGTTALLEAIKAGDVPAAARVLENDSTLVTVTRGPGPYGREQPLHLVCTDAPEGKRAELAELLLRHGADVHARDSDGYTPLEYAAHYGLVALAEPLIAHGASVNGEPPGMPPLLLAARGHNDRECRDFVVVLLKHGADLHARDSEGNDAMALAGLVHNVAVMGLLAEKGLPLDLVAAITIKRPDIVRQMLRNDPQLARKHPMAGTLLPKTVSMLDELISDAGGYNDPLKAETVIAQNLDVLELLLQQGAPKTSMFTMDEAVGLPHPAVLALLLRHGVGTSRAGMGIGLLELARQNRYCPEAMVALLQQHGVTPAPAPAVPPEAVVSLIKSLSDPQPLKRWLAVTSLEAYGPLARSSAAPLRDLAEKDRDAAVRSAARRALKFIDPEHTSSPKPSI